MLHAVTYALLDSINLLLIGVIVAIGVMLPPPPEGRYRRTSILLVAGDWLGVFLLALLTMFVFDSLGDIIKQLVNSPAFGILLIAVALLTAFMTWRGGDSSHMVAKILPPLKTPTWKTFVTGLILGLVQSVTSGPFFAGIAVLSAGDFSVAVRYLGMIFYASLALSLPTLTAILVGVVRMYPHSKVGQLFEYMRDHREQASAAAGYIVAVILGAMGLLHL